MTLQNKYRVSICLLCLLLLVIQLHTQALVAAVATCAKLQCILHTKICGSIGVMSKYNFLYVVHYYCPRFMVM